MAGIYLADAPGPKHHRYHCPGQGRAFSHDPFDAGSVTVRQ
jgi:hypothetical protein